MAQKKITIELNGTPIENDVHERALKHFEKLPIEDKNRVCEIIKNPNALSALKKNWIMLKAMFR